MAKYEVNLLGSPLVVTPEAGREFMGVRAFKLSEDRFVAFGRYDTSLTVTFVAVYEINKTTGEITELDFREPSSDATHYSNQVSACRISDTRFVYFYEGANDDGFYITYNVNASTGEITVWNNGEWSSNQNVNMVYAQELDGVNHVLVYYTEQGFRVLEVNLSTGVVSPSNSATNFTNNFQGGISEYASNKFLAVGTNNQNDGVAGVFTINPSTWAITTGGNTATTGAVTSSFWDVATINNGIDPVLFVAPYSNSSGGTTGQVLRQLNVNTGTEAITTLGTEVQVSTQTTPLTGIGLRRILTIDTETFLYQYNDTSNDLQASIYKINAGTGALTLEDNVEVTGDSYSYSGLLSMGDGVIVSLRSTASNQEVYQSLLVAEASISPHIYRRRLLV